MASRLPSTPPRGMRDILPREVEVRDDAIQTIVAVYRSYGYRRIETPALDNLRLLAGSEGGENEKLIFKILKRGEELQAALRTPGEELADLGLRFDLTVPLARYYAEHHARLPDPLKAIQIGSVWRAERPQKGRYRQFTQCDIDVLGVGSMLAEVELILATSEALARLGLAGLTVRLNDRRILAAIARHCGFAESEQAAFFIVFDKLDKVGPEGVLEELRDAGMGAGARARFERLLPTLQKGGLSLDALGAAVAETPVGAVDSLTSIVRTAGPQLAHGTRLEFDPTLVRGMGYYTGTIFEIASPEFPSSIAGGGRYDRMVGTFLGRDVPACGFSIGFERLIAILLERQGVAPAADAPARLALVVAAEAADLGGALAAAHRLRVAGAAVSVETRRKNFRKQLDDFAAHGFTGYALYHEGQTPVVTALPAARRPEG